MKKYHLILGQALELVTEQTTEIEIVLIYDANTVIADLFMIWLEALAVNRLYEKYPGCGFRMKASGFVSKEFVESNPTLLKYELKPSLEAFSLNYN